MGNYCNHFVILMFVFCNIKKLDIKKVSKHSKKQLKETL